MNLSDRKKRRGCLPTWGGASHGWC